MAHPEPVMALAQIQFDLLLVISIACEDYAACIFEAICRRTTFKTKAFDHGNPNKSIAKLLTKILYLKETASKP